MKTWGSVDNRGKCLTSGEEHGISNHRESNVARRCRNSQHKNGKDFIMLHPTARKAALLVLVLTLVSLLAVAFLTAHQVQARPLHGALASPASRTYACFLEDPQNPTTPACQAAIA